MRAGSWWVQTVKRNASISKLFDKGVLIAVSKKGLHLSLSSS